MCFNDGDLLSYVYDAAPGRPRVGIIISGQCVDRTRHRAITFKFIDVATGCVESEMLICERLELISRAESG